MTACPSCGHRFSVLIPDYGAVVAAANTLLAKTVSTSSDFEEEVAALESTPVEALSDLSTAQLKRLVENRDSSTAQLQAEAETLEESIERHMRVLYGYVEGPELDELPRAQHAKRELLRLRRIGDDLQRVMRSDLPLLPGELPHYEGRRPMLDGSHRSGGQD